MPVDIRTHPDAPDREDLGDFLVEPVPTDDIEERRAAGEELIEYNVLEADDLDVYAELDPEPFEPGHDDIGTILYRLVQLFGTPQFPEYRAGADISHREDTTFKYLFTLKEGASDPEAEPDDQWLITVHDWHVGLGVSLAEWREGAASEEEESLEADDHESESRDSGTDEPGDRTSDAFDRDRALASLALVYYVVTDSVQCVFADRWY
jgi:hypothetical protein